MVQIQTEITAAELSQAIGLNRPPGYWLKVLQANGLAIALIVGIVWADIHIRIAGKHISTVRSNLLMLVLLMIPVTFICLYWYSERSAVRRAVSRPSNTPGTASIDTTGISIGTSTGAPKFVPWSEFSGWKEGKDVFTLTKGKSFDVLTKRGLNESDIDQLRSLFRSQIR